MHFLLILLLTAPQEPAAVDALVRKLGAFEIAEREKASRELLALGETARPSLDRSARGDDKEIAARARAILDRLDRNIDVFCAALERIRTEAGPNYHRYLRNATQLFRELTLGKDADPISKSLERQGLKLRERRFYFEAREYLAKEGAYVSPSGIRHDLLLRLELEAKTSETEPTKWIVKSPEIDLVARPATEYSRLIEKAYPASTALQLALEHKAVREAAETYPMLMEIKLNYGLMRMSHRDTTAYWTFDVIFQLASRSNTEGASPSVTFASGLDPWETDGKKEDAGFESRDTIEPMGHSDGGKWSRSIGGWGRLERVSKEAKKPEEASKPAEVRGAGDVKTLPVETPDILIRGDKLCGEDCKDLVRFKALRSLEWSGEARIPDEAYEHLGKLASLESLELISHSEPTDECVEQLAGLVRLKRLHLTATSRLTDKAAQILARLPELTELSLHWCGGLTDASFETFAGMKRLTSLRLWGSGGITDAGLKALSKSASLRALTISHSKSITVAGFLHLEKMPALRDLGFGCLHVDDECLTVLGRMSKLEKIDLSYLENITDAGILKLTGLKNLQRLYFHSCPGVTKEVLKALQVALPGTYTTE